MPFSNDGRARLVAKSGYTRGTEGPGAPLSGDNGVVFPYTPNISVAYSADYSTYNLTHTNFQQQAYGKTNNPQLQLTANFISQTPAETAYAVAALHFLRVVTKMEWGEFSENPGTPPPVLDFSAYGIYNFNKVPVVVQGFNVIYDDNVDYVEGPDGTMMPTFMTVSIDLLPSYSPFKQNGFSIQSFARGELYTKGFI